MDQITLETTYIPHLRNQLSNGSAILFLGAGFSLDAINSEGKNTPSAYSLTQQLWNLCFPNEPFEESTHLQDIFETALDQQRPKLTELLQSNFTINPDLCPAWYTSLLTLPWLRIYTLNIDDLVSKILDLNPVSRRVRIVSAITENTPLFDESKLSVIHLNGKLDDGPENLTFSRSQYAQRIGRDPAYAQLQNDLLFRPVVFLGSSMEEGPLWEHLEMRGQKGIRGQREIRPRSYLIVPALNRSKEALLARHNIVWLPFKGSEFCSEILDKFPEERTSGHNALRELANLPSVEPTRFVRASDLAASDRDSNEYLLGAEPSWSDVTKARVAERECFESFWSLTRSVRAETTRKRVIALTGTAGTGKSSLLLATALRLEADGVSVGWIDSSLRYSRHGFRAALGQKAMVEAILINDSDAYDSRLSEMMRDALDRNPRLLIIFEVRSSKVGRVVNLRELNNISVDEFVVPPLQDKDIDLILDVLERNHRLGELKAKSPEQRRSVFQGLAGRQMLVAMHIATHGRDFEEKAQSEFRDLGAEEQFLYGLVCVASAHRFSLRQDDIGLAVLDDNVQWIHALDSLARRKIIFAHSNNSFRARHRVIAQFVYDSLSEEGRLTDIVRALIRIGAAKTNIQSSRDALHTRILTTFVNHNLMKRSIGAANARAIYNDFENALAWSHHYWLHRGALELETDNLDRAEIFLQQAKALNERDVFVDNELAYLNFKKAIENPTRASSKDLIDDAIATLEDVMLRRPDQSGHCVHILGSQGLAWSRVGISEIEEKEAFLTFLRGRVKGALDMSDQHDMVDNLHSEIQREILSLAVIK